MNARRTLPPIFLSLFVLAVWTSQAQASLIGDTINARWQFPPGDFDENDDFLVGPGIEGDPWLGSGATLDIGASTIDIDFATHVIGLNEGVIWTFSSLDWVGMDGIITGVSAGTNWSGWSDDFISFGDDFIRVNFLNGVSFDGASDFLSMSIETTHGVPVPAPLLLFGLGLAGIGFGLRRR